MQPKHMLLGTLDEISEMLEIAKQPLTTSVKLVPIVELVTMLGEKVVTNEWDAIEYLVSRRESAAGWRVSIDFWGIFETAEAYLEENNDIASIEELREGDCDPIPLGRVGGVLCVPVYINKIRYDIIRNTQGLVPVTGNVVFFDRSLVLPKDQPVFSPADVFRYVDIGHGALRYHLWNIFTLLEGQHKDIPEMVLDKDMRCMLLDWPVTDGGDGTSAHLPPHLRDVDI